VSKIVARQTDIIFGFRSLDWHNHHHHHLRTPDSGWMMTDSGTIAVCDSDICIVQVHGGAVSELAREDAVVLAQLHTGQGRMMGPLRAKVQRLDPTCRWCGVAVETVDHLFNECAGEGIKELKESRSRMPPSSIVTRSKRSCFSLRPIEIYSHTGDNIGRTTM
jgi:hypothetical protein